MDVRRWRLLSPGWLGVALLAGMLGWPAAVWAHGGGTPRLTNAPAGPYRIYAWSEPEPWRVGEVHLSLAVVMPNPDTTSNQSEVPVNDADVRVTFAPSDGSRTPWVVTAVNQTLLNSVYYEADTALPAPGVWRVTVAADGPEGAGSVEFTLEALPPRTVNWLWVGGAGVVVVIMAGLGAVWSRGQKSADTRAPHPGARRLSRKRVA